LPEAAGISANWGTIGIGSREGKEVKKMKHIVAIGMALMFALGVAGFGFAADKGTMKHEDVKICANVDCCGNQAKTTLKGSESKKADDQKLEKVYDIKPSDG